MFYDLPSQEEGECPVDTGLTGEGVKRGMTYGGRVRVCDLEIKNQDSVI